MIPENLRYTKDHEWVAMKDGAAVVGITHYAQEKLGDITYVELPETDCDVGQHDEICTVESIKAVGDIYAPIAGKVADVNGELDDCPELVNEDPYGKGWIYKLQDVDESQLDGLLTPEQYAAHVKEMEDAS